MASRFYQARKQEVSYEDSKSISEKTGLLFASGLITGEALVGILLALPIAITQNADFFKIFELELPSWFGALILMAICYLLYLSITRSYHRSSP